jgi:hypothetical protein
VTFRKACPWQRTGGRSTGSAPAKVVETPMVSQMEDFTSAHAFRVVGPKAFAEASITHRDVGHLMICDAPCSLPGASFAHRPIYGLEDLTFVPRGEAGAFIAARNTAPAVSCRSPPVAAVSPICVLGLPETGWMPRISSASPALPTYLS